MKIEFEEVFEAFKNLNENEKINAIINFIKKNIQTLNILNNDIGNNLDTRDIDKIVSVSFDDKLDTIYEMLHIMTEQFELFSEKISNDFYE